MGLKAEQWHSHDPDSLAFLVDQVQRLAILALAEDVV
jgi:hypothetical protein